jgi:hypothetical protein
LDHVRLLPMLTWRSNPLSATTCHVQVASWS